MRVRIVPIGASVMVLAACSHLTPPPAVTYDSVQFKPAKAQHDPAPPAPPPPIPVGTVFGPMLPIPDAQRTTPAVPSSESVEVANREALHEPSSDGYINAAQVYSYSENALYRLYTAPQQVSDVALQPGETLSAISAGDTVRWAVGDTTSGTGKDRQVHVLVKPFAAGLNTDLVILTDKHTYHLKLQSTEHTAMATVSWSYPADSLITTKDAPATAAPTTAAIDNGLVLENISFRYAITGDNPSWRPVRAFDDGHKVYIEFPDRIDQGEAPPLFVVGPDGDSQLVNYRVRANYYIVDRLFGAAELRLGQDKQQVVRISRTNGKQAPKAGG